MDNSKWFKWCKRLLLIFLGYFISQISPPLFTDLYNVTLKKWFFERKAMVTLYAVSTTTLSTLSNYKENNRDCYEKKREMFLRKSIEN